MMNKKLIIVYILFVLLTILSCKPKQNAYLYPSGNAVQDYFYRKGYAYPFYCDSLKPVCKKEDYGKLFGKYEEQRKELALQACAIIKEKYGIDSLQNIGGMCFTVFPVHLYFLDSPVVWYRVVFREYKNNTNHDKKSIGNWQLIDSNRILATYHNLEFQVNEGGKLELMCEQLL